MLPITKGFILLAASAAAVTAASRTVTATFFPGLQGQPIVREHMQGTCLPVWNSKQVYADIRTGLEKSRYGLFRFPNGSTSNDYHWNGNGSYTGDGRWECDSVAFKPGFVSQLKYRGTSKDHYGFQGASAITDGDTTTFWWSDPLLSQSKPYFYLEFSPSVRADSIVIYWGRHYGVDFVVQRWNAPGASYPGPYQAATDIWVTVDSVTGATGGVYAGALDTNYLSNYSGYFRVLVTKTNGDSGWQVREVYLYNKDTLVTKNVNSYSTSSAGSQTKVVALGTHGGTVVRPDWATGWVDWDFETFMAYCDSFPYTATPIICVNFGTGTPQEAARWVYYANVAKKYGIKYWQVGNEMDGYWEEGGPVDAGMYAEKFLMFSKAMKTEDSSIKVFGPVLSTADIYSQASGRFDGLTWMESFLKTVGEQEAKDGAVYLDGIDIHSYPYYFSSVPNATSMLDKSDFIFAKADSLRSMMKRRLQKADSLYVSLSEFNMSVVMASMLQEPVNGICVANLYASLAEKFGSRAMSVVWDSYENLSAGPGGTWGSLSLFTPSSAKALSSFTRPPASIYWPLFMAGRLWLTPDRENRVSPVQCDQSSKVRAFGVASAGSFRTLLLNLSADTVRLNCVMNDSSYNEIDVYSWSGREFRWNGTGADAFAMPNCGPSSTRMSAGPADTLVLLPLSCTVAAWHNRDIDTLRVPEFLHTGRSAEKVRGSDSLRFWGTTTVNGSTISRLAVCVDTGAAVAVGALDGKLDGPSESWFMAIAARDLGVGPHLIVVSAQTKAGKIASDTFSVVSGDSLRPVLLIDNFEDRDLVSSLPSKARWNKYQAGTPSSYINLSIDSSYSSGSAGALRADFSIVKPATLTYDVYGSVFVNIDTVYMDTVRPRPIGITFKYASKNSNSDGTFILQVQSTPVTDYDFFTIPLASTNGAWQKVTAEWTDIRQEGWGKHIDSLPAHQINRLEFRTVMGGTGFLMLDDVAFINDSGRSVLPIVHAMAAAARVSLSVMPRTDGLVVVSWTPAAHASALVRIFNARGVAVHTSVPLQAGTAIYRWRSHAPGVYLVSMQTGNTRLQKKFCIVK